MPKRIVDKLVRDKIVLQMEAEGKKVVSHNIVLDAEKRQKLIEKLGEKYKELFEELIHQEQEKDKIVD
jgi:predicted house-cleaning noncanonical NTP pyrophosphatase (MazG superfamily)